MEKGNITIREERISAEEYIDFLKRTDLGSQYPIDDQILILLTINRKFVFESRTS